MKLLVARATGAVGRPLVRQLVAAGHEVAATSRSPERAAGLRELGAEPVVCDALDPAAVDEAVAAAAPEAIVNELTATGGASTRARWPPSSRPRIPRGARLGRLALRRHQDDVVPDREPLPVHALGALGVIPSAVDELAQERRLHGEHGVRVEVLARRRRCAW